MVPKLDAVQGGPHGVEMAIFLESVYLADRSAVYDQHGAGVQGDGRG
jgi:hypothetical protein